jgi:hypothetical protein
MNGHQRVFTIVSMIVAAIIVEYLGLERIFTLASNHPGGLGGRIHDGIRPLWVLAGMLFLASATLFALSGRQQRH